MTTSPSVLTMDSHRSSDLPVDFKGWDSDIINEISRLKVPQPWYSRLTTHHF